MMQWTDVTAPPKERILRQFAGVWLVFFAGAAIWRAAHARADARAIAFVLLALVIGGLGLWRPRTIRYAYTAAMIAAFPIGWITSKVVLAAFFFVVFTGVGWAFRLMGRDHLRIRPSNPDSFWIEKPSPPKAESYFRQF